MTTPTHTKSMSTPIQIGGSTMHVKIQHELTTDKSIRALSNTLQHSDAKKERCLYPPCLIQCFVFNIDELGEET
jgi:hypothetical protein